MATSGAMNTSNSWIKYTITVTQNSQSVETNTSNVTVSVRFYRTNTGYSSYGTGTVYCKIDGTKYSAGVTPSQKITENGIVLFTKTLTISHNDDGSKTLVCSAWIEHEVVSSSEQSYSQALTTIARASQPSCITFPEHTQNVGKFGDTISIHMNRKNGLFLHEVYYVFGNVSGVCVDADTGMPAIEVENGIRWKIPESLMNYIPENTSGSGTIRVTTYHEMSGDVIGTKTCGFTATVPDSVKPTVSMTLEDITGVDDIYGSPVKGLSKIKIKVNATTAYNSPIASYQITANGVKFSEAEATTDFLTTAGDSPVVVTATDKRGRKNSATYTMKVQDYTPPAISKLAVTRCNENGTQNKRGGYIKITFSAVVSSLGGKNTAAYSIQYKKTSETNWTELQTDIGGKNPASLNNNYSPTDQSFIFAANVGNSFDISVTVADRHHTNPKTAKIPTAASVFSWRGFKNSNGNREDGAGIGKVPEKPNCLQVGWDAEFDKTVKRTGNRYCFSTQGIAGTDGFIKMARMTHKKANADTPITFVFTRRLCPHPMTVHIQFKSDSTTIDPELKTISYEGNNYGAFLVKSQESVWDLYVQKVSAYDTITLQDWFSSGTVDDRLTVEFPGDLVDAVPQGLVGYYRATPAVLESVLDCFMPVGYVLILYSHVDPSTMYPGTTWERIENAFLWGCDANGAIGTTGGEKTHTLTANELPAHNHGSVYSGNASGTKSYAWLASGGSAMAYGTVSTGGGAAHNNMPPYIQVSIWRRTA